MALSLRLSQYDPMTGCGGSGRVARNSIIYFRYVYTCSALTGLKDSPVAQSVASLTADPGVTSLIPAQSHSFMEIDHEIISTGILLLPLIHVGLLSVTSESIYTKYWLRA